MDPEVPFRASNERFAGLDGGVLHGDPDGDEVFEDVEVVADAEAVVPAAVPLEVVAVRTGVLAVVNDEEVIRDNTAEADEGRARGKGLLLLLLVPLTVENIPDEVVFFEVVVVVTVLPPDVVAVVTMLSFSVDDTDEIDEILTSLETSVRAPPAAGSFLGVRRGELGHDCVAKKGFRSRTEADIPLDPVIGIPWSLMSLTIICPGRDVTDDMDEIDVTESVRCGFAAR